MNESQQPNFRPLRQRPLALCLVCALGAGVAGATDLASGAMVGRPLAPPPPRHRITGPADLPADNPLRAAWEQRLAHPPPARPAATIPVTNCNDSGAGSLRDAVTNAVDGDTIDMTALTCSLITLTTGVIGTFVNYLTLEGPGSNNLAISGNGTYEVFAHVGYGTLTVSDVTIEHGYKYDGFPRGGCVFSQGNVHLYGVVLQDCYVAHTPFATSYPALGGAVYARGQLFPTDSYVGNSRAYSFDTDARGGGIFSASGGVRMIDSLVANNSVASAGVGAHALGGGIYSGGDPITTTVSAFYGSVENNTARGYDPSTIVAGGGIYTNVGIWFRSESVMGNAVESIGVYASAGGMDAVGGYMAYSTIANNYSSHSIGGISTGGVYTSLFIADSTISGNVANYAIGGVFCTTPAKIYNSTIAFNVANSNGLAYTMSAGLNVVNQPLVLQSSIVAQNYNNEYPAHPYSDLGGGTVVTGANNLVRSSYVQVPGDTITGTDPLLLPLADNGGLTMTHALDASSPAIDAGNNSHYAAYDQRGAPYWRVVGANADIGAFESNFSEIILANGFDP